MKFKEISVLLLGIIYAGSTFTACSDKKNESFDESETVNVTTTAETTVEPIKSTSAAIEIEKAVEAKSGDAYLAIADGQWYVQYWGTNADLLTYDAGVAEIKENGNYTVSVNGASKGMILDVTGSADDSYTPSGCSFMAVIVKDGKLLYPNMSIDITSIRINGEEIERTSQSYTTSDDDIEMRANIYNEWANELPEDAHNADGVVTDNTSYSAQIIDKNSIGPWTKIEVDFTVSGIGDDSEEPESDEE
ncbi:MAG: hypothetical protein K2H01_07905 [Ruminococcus sp.]|nr:hypothetical protein [Ruminococcus sp.]